MKTLPTHQAEQWLFGLGDAVAERRVRRGVGLLVLWWAASWLVGGVAGLPGQFVAPAETGPLSWSVLGRTPSAATATLACLALLCCGALVLSGVRARWGAVGAFVLVVSIQRTDPFGLNAGDALLRLLTLWLAVGAMVGGARVLARGEEKRPQIVVRLVQIQVVAMYVTAGLWKLQREQWQVGEAVHMALTDVSTANDLWPSVVVESPVAITMLTWGTLILELALGPLLLFRRTRTVAVVLAAAMHVLFALSLRIGIFSPAALVALLSFTGHLRRSR